MNTNTDNTIEGAIVEVKPDNALVVIDPKRYATELFEPFLAQLAQARRKAKRVEFYIATKPGMALAKELRTTFVKIRTAADKAKTEAKRPIDQAGKEILAQFSAVKEAAEAEEARFDQAIKAEEARIEAARQAAIAAERARQEAIENRLAHLRGIPAQFVLADSVAIQQQIETLVHQRLDPADYEEFLEGAVLAQNTSIEQLKQYHAAALAREDAARKADADRAELARLQAAERERKERDAETQRQQAAAAAAMQKQQQQMADIMEIQGLAAALEAAGQHQDRASIEAAIAKAEAFDPASFGAMAGMAKLARDAAYPLLVGLLESLPQEPPLVDMLMGDKSMDWIEDHPTDAVIPVISDTIPVELDDTGIIVGQAVIVDEPAPRKVIPASKRPSDLDIVQVLTMEFSVTADTVINWIACFDIDATRAVLAKA